MSETQTGALKQGRIATEIFEERDRQFDKFGNQKHNPVEWMAILTEEVGEAAKQAVDYHFKYGLHGSDLGNEIIQNQRLKDFRKELVQIAAVAMQTIEDLDERYIKK